MIALVPSRQAAHATACPWFPADAATTPRESRSRSSDASFASAPRTLYARVGLTLSIFSHSSHPSSRDSGGAGSSGVGTERCLRTTARARSMSARLTGASTGTAGHSRCGLRALVKSRAEPGIWLEDVPKPGIGPNDLLIRVHYTSICGTDLHIVNWDAWAQRTIRIPLIIGHEFEGSVVEIGSEVRGFERGQRVAVEGHVTCGHCRNCRAGRRHLCRNTQGIGVQRSGAFADYIAVPAANAYVLSPGMPDEIGS